MGQHQLLLLTIGIVITALAVISATYLFKAHNETIQFDSLTFEAIRISADAIEWKYSPAMFGGGKSTTYLTGLTFDAMGYDNTSNSGQSSTSIMYQRTLSGLDTSTPKIVIVPVSNTSIRVSLEMYGPYSNCFRLIRGRLVNGSWVDANIGESGTPSGCKTWAGSSDSGDSGEGSDGGDDGGDDEGED